MMLFFSYYYNEDNVREEVIIIASSVDKAMAKLKEHYGTFPDHFRVMYEYEDATILIATEDEE